MKSKLLILFVSVLFFTACGTTKKSTNKVTKIKSDAFSETYSGIIPCADCAGIEYTIDFNEDFSYKSQSVYQGKSNELFESSGNYRIQNGVIQLINEDEGIKYFKKRGNHLLILDRNQKEVTGKLSDAYVLKPVAKQPETAEGNIHKLKLKRASEGVDFFAIGNEPFWTLNLDFDDKFHFEALAAISLTTPPIAAQSMLNTEKANYSITTESGALEIEIRKENCQDGMSGQLFDYAVSVSVNDGTNPDFTNYSGCGTYTFDLKLHDIWILEAIDGKVYTDSDFSSGLPRLEIFTEEQRFGGKDGCNILTGNIETSANTIAFKDAISTKMACRNNTQSDLYRETILETPFSFTVKNGHLLLSDSTGERLRFKKID